MHPVGEGSELLSWYGCSTQQHEGVTVTVRGLRLFTRFLPWRSEILRAFLCEPIPASVADAVERARAAAIAQSEGVKQAEINTAQGQAAAILSIAEANAKAIKQVAEAINSPGGINAVNLKVAEQYVAAFSNLAKTSNTLIVPSNLSDLAGLVSTATTVFKAQER